MQQKKPLQFGIKSLLLVCALVALVICVTQWFQTDDIFRDDETIFRTEWTATVTLPLGQTFVTNDWLDSADVPMFAILGWNGGDMIQGHDATNVATMKFGGEQYTVIVEYADVDEQRDSAVYRLRPGKRVTSNVLPAPNPTPPGDATQELTESDVLEIVQRKVFPDNKWHAKYPSIYRISQTDGYWQVEYIRLPFYFGHNVISTLTLMETLLPIPEACDLASIIMINVKKYSRN